MYQFTVEDINITIRNDQRELLTWTITISGQRQRTMNMKRFNTMVALAHIIRIWRVPHRILIITLRWMAANGKFTMANRHSIDRPMDMVVVFEAADHLLHRSPFASISRATLIHRRTLSQRLHQKFDTEFYTNRLPGIWITEQVSSSVSDLVFSFHFHFSWTECHLDVIPYTITVEITDHFWFIFFFSSFSDHDGETIG